MTKRFFNYEHLNRHIYGGLLPFKYDYIEIVSRNAQDKPTQIDFYQNSKGETDSKKAMELYLTYDGTGLLVATIESKILITVEESM